MTIQTNQRTPGWMDDCSRHATMSIQIHGYNAQFLRRMAIGQPRTVQTIILSSAKVIIVIILLTF